MSVTVRSCSPSDPDFLALVAQLDEFLTGIDGDRHDFYHQFNDPIGLSYAVVAYQDDLPVGCGGFKPLDSQVAEVKRMYVDPEARGTGVGRLVLDALEQEARRSGYRALWLETHKRLEPAIRLYRSAGYSTIPNFGPYVGVEDSVCFEKVLPAEG